MQLCIEPSCIRYLQCSLSNLDYWSRHVAHIYLRANLPCDSHQRSVSTLIEAVAARCFLNGWTLQRFVSDIPHQVLQVLGVLGMLQRVRHLLPCIS